MQLQPGEFLGDALRAHASGGFTLTEYAYAPGAALTGRALLRAAMRLRRMAGAREPSLLRIDAAAIELLAALPARGVESHPPRWLGRVVDCLRASQPRRPSGELATVAGVHPVHLARTFRGVYGCSIDDFVRTLRVERARELLRRGDPLATIAFAAGFSDQSHFCRDFKRVAGVTPREFRRVNDVGPLQDAPRRRA